MSEICDTHKCTGNSISWRQDAVEKASTQQREPSGPRLISWGDQTSWREDAGMRTCLREAGPPGLWLSSPGEWERNAVIANRVGINMLQFCSVSNSLSHTTLSIKWEVYFSKNLCRPSLLYHHYDSACRCRCRCITCLYSWSWLYNNSYS